MGMEGNPVTSTDNRTSGSSSGSDDDDCSGDDGTESKIVIISSSRIASMSDETVGEVGSSWGKE